jgi:hypothetical protein
VRFKKLRVLEGVVLPSFVMADLGGVCRSDGKFSCVAGGVDGAEGGGEVRENGRCGLALRTMRSSSDSSWWECGVGWLILKERAELDAMMG